MKEPSVLEPYHQVIKGFLDEDDYQATWIWQRIKNLGYTGSYRTLTGYVATIKEQKRQIAYTRFETEPGLQAQVDWGDFKVVDDKGGTITVYAFVLLLGFSRAMYIEFVERCTLETFMDCHIRAFKHLGGVPAEVLYDNMKNVVIGREKGKPNFNLEFLHFARHYGFTPRVCPPYSPWVKGKVERPMHYVRENFWRGYAYSSLFQANQDVMRWKLEVADQRIHATHRQQVIVRWEQEVPHLGELPLTDYDTSVKYFRKVYKDCLLSYGGNRYYVPPEAVGKKVLLKVKGTQVRIYYDDALLKQYEIPEQKGQTLGVPKAPPRLPPQQTPRYGRDKGKATRGLTTGTCLDTDPVTREFWEFYRTPRGIAIPEGRTLEQTQNRMLTSEVRFVNYYPFNDIETISPRPMLFITGDQAHSKEFSQDAYKLAAEPKELYWVPGAGHVDLYDRVDIIPWAKLSSFFTNNLRK